MKAKYKLWSSNRSTTRPPVSSPPLPVAGSGERVAKDIFAAIKDYSQYDCLSTWKLRDWLLDLAR